MDDNESTYFVEKTITGDDLLTLINAPGKHYVFRGQSCCDWNLESSFERACGKDSIYKLGWKDLEDKIRIEFKRQAHHYLTKTPESEFEWLALMQHYGAPTRLLDFTKSAWVALFFAVDGAMNDSALWAVDTSYFKSNHLLPQQRRTIASDYNEELVAELESILEADITPDIGEQHADEWNALEGKIDDNDPTDFELGIIFAEPFFKNQRLSIQQGIFAFQTELISDNYSYRSTTIKITG